MQKYYICSACGFQFTRFDMPEQCPDCGKERIREATEEEKIKFEKLLYEREQWAKSKSEKSSRF